MSLLPSVADALDRHGLSHSVMDCDPALADTAAFCEAYGVDLSDSANTILVASRKPEGTIVACVVLATHRLDVNGTVRRHMGVRKASFADADTTVTSTGMEIGGVTPPGLPDDIPVLVSPSVMERTEVVIGGGNRSSKIRLAPGELVKLPNVTVVEALSSPAS